MGKRRDERRMERAAEKAGAVVFEPTVELTGLEVENPPPPSTVVVTEVDREAGEVTVESVPASVEEAIDRLAESVVEETGEPVPTTKKRGVVRFVQSVRLWDVTYARLGQVTEARAEDFEVLVMPLGVGIRGHGCDLFVPWANVRSVDCPGAVDVMQMMARHHAGIGP